MLSVALLTYLLLAPQGDLKLPNFFSDNMVLQRDRPVRIWGSTRPGEQVTATVGGRIGRGVAGPDGRFTLELDPLKAGGPYELVVQGGGERRLKNVLVGEVWVCSGQSNMEWNLSWIPSGAEEAAKASYPNIRLLTVPKVSSETPLENVNATWQTCTPATVRSFSAVGYFFGRSVHERLGVPVGLINSSWGGTPAESWTPRSALASHRELSVIAKRYEDVLATYPQARQAYETRLAQWQAGVEAGLEQLDGGPTWTEAPSEQAGWKPLTVPGLWEGQGLAFDGTVWISRTFEVPAGIRGPLTLTLGAIDDYDTTFVNGVKVGAVSFGTPGAHTVSRQYKVNPAILRPGLNVVSVRVHDTGGSGGFSGIPEQVALVADGQTIPLAGTWWHKVEKPLPAGLAELMRGQPQPPMGPGNPWAPGGLWNGMIAPLLKYPIRGAIWYQGESNAGRAEQYQTLFPFMIRQWRQAWGLGDFPFLFVQLANFMARKPDPGGSEWAELREAQLKTLALQNTGMAVAIDIGDAGDIHPANKVDVGRRLAFNALKTVYGQAVVPAGPIFRSAKVEGNRIRLSFENSAGLRAAGPTLKGFAVAGADRKFVWADAAIEGQTVVVSSRLVKSPLSVRYGWADNPDVNLVNGAGLPASPFRTDSWPGLTAGRR